MFEQIEQIVSKIEWASEILFCAKSWILVYDCRYQEDVKGSHFSSAYVSMCVWVPKKLMFNVRFFSLYRTSYLPKPAYLWHIPLLTLASRTCFILWNRSLFLICSNSLVNFMLTANRTSMCLLLIRRNTESRESERSECVLVREGE